LAELRIPNLNLSICENNRCKRESLIPIPESQSAFHPHVQRNAFRRGGVHQQSKSFALRNPKLAVAFGLPGCGSAW
jgi:hypothetical protein